MRLNVPWDLSFNNLRNIDLSINLLVLLICVVLEYINLNSLSVNHNFSNQYTVLLEEHCFPLLFFAKIVWLLLANWHMELCFLDNPSSILGYQSLGYPSVFVTDYITKVLKDRKFPIYVQKYLPVSSHSSSNCPVLFYKSGLMCMVLNSIAISF